MILLLSTNIVVAQSQCKLKIITDDGEPECLLTSYTEKGEFPITDNFGDDRTTLVCRGKTVTYTVSNAGDMLSYEWVVNGSENYTVSTDGKSIVVTWDDATVKQVSLEVTAISSSGVKCTDIKYMYIVETPDLNTVVLQGYVEQTDGTKIISVCKGETVEFIDNSQYSSNTNVTGYYWTTGSGMVSSSKNFKIEDIDSMTIVRHRVMSYCGCEAEETFVIEVIPEKALQLSCHGTVCEGSIVTYSPEDINCSRYNWVVENGTIIGASDSSKVKVEWGSPESGYGIISLDGSECDGVCPKIIPVKIPIISSNVIIAGKEEVCKDESVVFELPLWGSTDYTWEIQPNIPMTDAQNVNQKIVKFSQVGTYTLTCKVHCPFLDCGELTVQSKTITVKPVLDIDGKESICIGGTTSFATNTNNQNAANNQWTLYKNKDVLATSTGSTFIYTFTDSGRYKLEVTNSDYCNTAVKYLEAYTLPVPQITGNHSVCPKDGDSLTVINANPNYWIHWSCDVPNAYPHELTSESTFVIRFGGLVGDVKARFEDKSNHCMSDVTTFEIQAVELEDLTPFLPTQITGKKSGDTIRLQMPKQNGVFYRWSVPVGRATILTDFTSNNAVFVINRSKDGTYPDFQIKLRRITCNDYENPVDDVVTVSGVTDSKITVSGDKCKNTPITFSTNRIDTANAHYTWIIDGVQQATHTKTIQHTFTTIGHKIVKLKYQINGLAPYIQTMALDIKDCGGATTNSLDYLEELTDVGIMPGEAVNSIIPPIIDTFSHIFDTNMPPLNYYDGDFDLYYDCKTNAVYIDNIKSGNYKDMICNPYSSSYLRWQKDGGTVHSVNPITTTSISISTYGYGTYSVAFNDTQKTFVKEINVYPPTTNILGAITFPNYNGKSLCGETPYTFTANISGDYDYCYWDFGNGSIMEDNPIEYTYGYNYSQDEYWACIVAVDKNGCHHRLDSVFCKIQEGVELGKLSAYNAVCPGGTNVIKLESTKKNNPIQPILWNPTKEAINDNGNTMEYLAYQTGDYLVKIQDTTGCISESSANVYFHNKPVAEFITFSQSYCKGYGFIVCFGENGYRYDWKITSDGQVIDEKFSVTDNVYNIGSLSTGTYKVEVTVYTEKNCSDSISGIFTIYSNPPSPTLTIDPNNACIHEPPVIISGTPAEVFWSNGTHGKKAFYYQSGTVNAFVQDMSTGCTSPRVEISIAPAPNLDALLSGCYEKCVPAKMETFGLSPIPFSKWLWNLNGSYIQSGAEQNPTLDIPGEGVYNMDANYNNYNCFVQSNDLQIIQPKICDCEGIVIRQGNTRYSIRDCRIIYEIEVIVCNNSDEVLNINQWLSQQEVNIINIQDSNTTTISQHRCKAFIITFEVNPSLDCANFTIVDEKRDCIREFALSLNHKENIPQGRCVIHVDKMNCSTDGLVVDVDFTMDIVNQANVLAVWTEPQGVVTYNYDGVVTVSGFAVFDRLKLQQMAENRERICFYVLMCKDDELCIADYCVRAVDILKQLDSKIQKQNISEQQIDEIYLQPNPATNKVTIVGLSNEQIANATVLDMTGKELLKDNSTNVIDIEKLQKGSYLVVVKDKENKVYYLKLIKQ